MMCTRTHTDNAHRHTQTHVHIYYICTCMHARRRPPIVVVVVDSFTISKLSSSSLRDKRPNRPITTRRRVPNQTRQTPSGRNNKSLRKKQGGGRSTNHDQEDVPKRRHGSVSRAFRRQTTTDDVARVEPRRGTYIFIVYICDRSWSRNRRRPSSRDHRGVTRPKNCASSIDCI